jgi:hypothetical protein
MDQSIEEEIDDIPNDFPRYVSDNKELVEQVVKEPMGSAALPKDVRPYTTLRENDKDMYEKLGKRFNLNTECVNKVSLFICHNFYHLLNKSSRQAHVMLVTDYMINCYLHEAGACKTRISKKSFGKD